MSFAEFLYQQTGWDALLPLIALKSVKSAHPKPQSLSPLTVVASEVDVEAIHIGPRGGKFRFDAKGRKVYLKTA